MEPTENTYSAETYGKGGAGNIGTNVNHGVESLNQHIGTGGTGSYGHPTGRGGAGNIHEGVGQYDMTGGHDMTDTAGRGGYGNATDHVPAHGTHTTHNTHGTHGTHATTGTPYGTAPFKETGGHSTHKVTAADKIIGSAEVALGKMTHNTGLVDKGMERKIEGSAHTTVPPPGAPMSGAPNEWGPSGDVKNRAI